MHSLFSGKKGSEMGFREHMISIFGHGGDQLEVCQKIERVFCEEFSFDHVTVVLRQGNDLFQLLTDETTKFVSEDNPILGHLRRSKIDVSVISSDAHDDEAMRQYFVEEKISAVLPLVFDSLLFGWVALHDKEEGTILPRKTLDLLQEHLPMIMFGFRGLWLDQSLVGHIDELETLNRISHTMNSSLNVRETLDAVMDAVMDFSRADRTLMYLLDEEEKHFIPTLGRGLSEDVQLNFQIEIEKSIFHHIVLEREPLVVKDVLKDRRVNQEYAKKVHTKSFVIVPMISKEKVIGIIGVDNLYSDRPIDEINVALLVTLANHAAIALSNSQLYEKTQHFNEELQKQVHEATDHLHQLLDMKSHFLSVASHQLRTPTTVVKGLLSMIVEDPEMDIDEMRKMLEQAYASTNRLERIIAELLTATELDDVAIKPFLEEFFVHEFVESLVNQLQPLAMQKKLNLRIDLPDEIIRLHTDKFKLQEALSNLVDNAIRYTEKGTVTVTVELSEEEVRFHVQDTGIGLSDADHGVIFDKFSRGERAHEIEPNGTGLGLFITKKIVEILNGELHVKSQGAGEGSLFSIHIPQKSIKI